MWRWVNTGSAPGYEPVRRLAAHLIAAHPQLADDAAALLPAAGYQTAPVIAAAAIAAFAEPPHETPADPGDDVTGAVIAALYGSKERRIWAQVRRRLAATPAGAALFTDPAQAAAWPAESPDGF